MSATELVEVVDENDNLLEVVPRQLSIDRNDTIRNTIVFVFNDNGQVVVQKRAKNKAHYPGVYDVTAAGAVTAGETPEASAARELAEEAGLKCRLQFAEKFLNVYPDETNTLTRKRISSVFYGVTNDTPIGDDDEVASIGWRDIDELLVELKQHPGHFVPSFKTEFDIAYHAYKKSLAG